MGLSVGSGAHGTARFVGLGWILWDQVMQVPGYPEENGKVSATATFGQVGGPVARALLQLRRFGAVARLVGAVGDDGLGRQALGELIRYGVDVGSIEVDPASPSRVAHVWLAADTGTRTVAYSSRGPDLFTTDAGDLHGVAALLLDGRHPDAARQLALSAAAAGVRIAVDMGGYKANLPELVQMADVIVGPRASWGRLAVTHGLSDPLDALASLSRPVCVLTDGPHPVLAAHNGELAEYVPVTVPTVDSNGAGDVFFGALVWAHAHGYPLGRALRFAGATAALKCGRLGNEALPTLAEVQSFMAEPERGTDAAADPPVTRRVTG